MVSNVRVHFRIRLTAMIRQQMIPLTILGRQTCTKRYGWWGPSCTRNHRPQKARSEPTKIQPPSGDYLGGCTTSSSRLISVAPPVASTAAWECCSHLTPHTARLTETDDSSYLGATSHRWDFGGMVVTADFTGQLMWTHSWGVCLSCCCFVGKEGILLLSTDPNCCVGHFCSGMLFVCMMYDT